MPKAPDDIQHSGRSGPKPDIDSSKNAREEVMPGEGPLRPLRPLEADEQSSSVAQEEPLRAFLEDPPAWLQTQLRRCREDEGTIKPTCASIAYQVYGTSTRWEEVKPFVERWLEGAR